MLCKVGEIEVWRILEINGPFLSPEELFPNNRSDARRAINTHCPDQLCPTTGKLILPIQGFLLKRPRMWCSWTVVSETTRTTHILTGTCVRIIAL